jgi:hypothetical protein
VALASALVFFGQGGFRAQAATGAQVFVLGLEPRRKYRIEVGREKALDESTDPAGILSVKLPPGADTSFRVREVDAK